MTLEFDLLLLLFPYILLRNFFPPEEHQVLLTVCEPKQKRSL